MCAVMTMNYNPKKKETPVTDQITEDELAVTQCSSSATLTIVPVGTKYLEVVTNNSYGFCSELSGSISTTKVVFIDIDAFKSFQTNQNTISSSVIINIRDGIGGTIEDSYRLYRDHTVNIC